MRTPTRAFPTLYILIIMTFGCKTSHKNRSETGIGCISISQPDMIEEKLKADTKILSILIEGNILTAEMEYASKGPQHKAEPYLLWNGALMKSLPPKASVEIGMVFTSPCENCDSTVTKTSVCFDISSLRKNTIKQGLVLMVKGFEKPISIPAEN